MGLEARLLSRARLGSPPYALNLMMSDGLLNILPRTNDAWVDFVRPFLRLTRIEKDFYKNKKK